MRGDLIWELVPEDDGVLTVQLHQDDRPPHSFAVVGGATVSGLDYAGACAALGAAVMGQLSCAGLLREPTTTGGAR